MQERAASVVVLQSFQIFLTWHIDTKVSRKSQKTGIGWNNMFRASFSTKIVGWDQCHDAMNDWHPPNISPLIKRGSRVVSMLHIPDSLHQLSLCVLPPCGLFLLGSASRALLDRTSNFTRAVSSKFESWNRSGKALDSGAVGGRRLRQENDRGEFFF